MGHPKQHTMPISRIGLSLLFLRKLQMQKRSLFLLLLGLIYLHDLCELFVGLLFLLSRLTGEQFEKNSGMEMMGTDKDLKTPIGLGWMPLLMQSSDWLTSLLSYL
jgi:hypothetical protein